MASPGRSMNRNAAALPLPYKQAGDFTYKQLRSRAWSKPALPESFKFAGLSYPQNSADGKAKDPETESWSNCPAWQELRKR
jgi:CRISPR-associated endonuclease Csn1